MSKPQERVIPIEPPRHHLAEPIEPPRMRLPFASIGVLMAMIVLLFIVFDIICAVCRFLFGWPVGSTVFAWLLLLTLWVPVVTGIALTAWYTVTDGMDRWVYKRAKRHYDEVDRRYERDMEAYRQAINAWIKEKYEN